MSISPPLFQAKKLHLEKLPPFFTIGEHEREAILGAIRRPLSGYLGGVPSTGFWVNKLMDDWCGTFGCNFAIPCNSGTSGLLAACMAIGLKPGDLVWISAYTMSATAACCKVLGATTVFIDIETTRFSMNLNQLRQPLPKCIIVTNLFGHPAYLAAMRTWCDSNNVWMIEDNAQAPFAEEDDRYTGTIGHIGVFSLNVHKHIQCGEGGVIVTDLDYLAERLNGAINHGELTKPNNHPGLNLRMTEPIAAIACIQLKRAKKIIAGRIELAEQLTDMFKAAAWLRPPVQDAGCRHVYYMWAAIVGSGLRSRFLWGLQSRGFPMLEGYSPTLNRIFASEDCLTADSMEDHNLITYEVCAYNPTSKQRNTMREIAKLAIDECNENSRT